MNARYAAVIFFATAVAVSTIYVPQAIFGDIGAHFAVSPLAARSAFTVTTFTYAVSFFVIGPLSDRLDGRKLATAGAVAAAAFAGTAPYLPSYPLFVTALAVAGVAAAAVPAAMFALVPRIAPKDLVGTYFGLVLAATVAGVTIGRVLGGVIAGLVGWQLAFLILAAACAVAAVPVWFLPQSHALQNATPVVLIYRRALGMYLSGPVVRLLGIGALLFFGYFGTTTFLTFHLSANPFYLDAKSIGLISLVGLAALAGSPAAGRLVPRLGARLVALSGLGVCAAGMALLGVATSVTAATAGLLLVFLGVFAAQPALMVGLMSKIDPARRGAASSAYLLACLVGGAAGSALLGYVWSGEGWTGIIWSALASLIFAGGLTAVSMKNPAAAPVAAVEMVEAK